VKQFRVIIQPLAKDDLLEIHTWLRDVASLEIAEDYLDRLEAHIRTLESFPNRGTLRPKAGEEVRSITFERKLIIGYRVRDDEVWIERVISGARDKSWFY
jgi:toxin ParE1/3/4